MKRIYTLLVVLISLIFSLEIIASDNQVVSKSIGCTSINGKGVATFVVKSPVTQSCDLSFLMMPGEYEDGSFTSVTLKVNGVSLQNPITFNTYGWQSANTTGNAVTLNEGDNIVQFISGRDDVPVVNGVKILDSYVLFTKGIKTNSNFLSQMAPIDTTYGDLKSAINYEFVRNLPYLYTTYIPLTFNDTTWTTLYAPTAKDPMYGLYESKIDYTAYIFNEDCSYSESISTNNKYLYWQDSIPPGNYYILLEGFPILSSDSLCSVTLRVNSVIYKNCFATTNNAQFRCEPLRKPGIDGCYYNMFTTNSKSRIEYIEPDPMLWLKMEISDNKYIVIAHNNNNNTRTAYNWGNNARIRCFFKDSILYIHNKFSLLLSSANPESKTLCESTDLYYSKLRQDVFVDPNMQEEDIINSLGGLFEDRSYNCYAWSAGSNIKQLSPPEINQNNILWFDSLYNNQMVYSILGYFQRDSSLVRCTREGADSTNAIIAIFGDKFPDGSYRIRHAAIKDNIYDGIPHGYSWESKDFLRSRFFHPINLDTTRVWCYGQVLEFYRPITESTRTLESTKRFCVKAIS